ncbi:MAG: carbohydrate kinase family protein [Omnitrophica WOR_2 bacterium]
MAEVGCAGILVSDTFCGPMQELPREGQLLAVNALPTKAGGCASNVAVDLVKQGIKVDIAGCLGTDPSARVLLTSLEEYGIGLDHIVYTPNFPTSKTVILLVSGQDRRYIHSFGANAAFTVADIDREWVKQLKVFYLGGLFLMPAFRPDELVDLLLFCRQHGVISVVDVVIPQNTSITDDLKPLLNAADYFLPNEDEASVLTGRIDPFEQMRTLLDWGAKTVIITRGKSGVLAGRGGQFWQAGIYTMPVTVDPSGCGDAFAAGVVTGITRGWDYPEMIRYASALGASAVRAIGTTDGVFNSAQADEFISANSLDVEQGNLSLRAGNQE